MHVLKKIMNPFLITLLCVFMIGISLNEFFLKTLRLSNHFAELSSVTNAAVVQLIRTFASYAKGWVFESQPRQT